jgi:flagellar biosynthesis protein
MRSKVAAWNDDRNNRQANIDWQFRTDDARIKPKLDFIRNFKLYSVLGSDSMPPSQRHKKAVALQYDQQKNSAPQVLASGSGLIAENILRKAAEAGTYIRKDSDLAELLSKVPVGEEIPEEMYKAIAEVLSFVYSVNERFKNKQQVPHNYKKTEARDKS